MAKQKKADLHAPVSKTLTGKLDRKEAYKKSFKRKAIILPIVGLIGGLLLGYVMGGGDTETMTPLSLLRALTDPNFDKSMYGLGLMIGFVAGLFMDAYAYMNYEKFKNMRPEEEHGNASLMTVSELPKFNQQFFYDPKICEKYDDNAGDKNYTHYDYDNLKKVCTSYKHNPKADYACFLNSQIMGQNVYVSMNTKFINRNLNTITIGGSGQGKSFSELFPNALSANCNYVFTDPSGEIYQKVGKFLQMAGYELKVFNVDEFNLSMKYNPLAYVDTEKDYNILVDALNKNIKPDKTSGGGGGNEFFDDAKDSLVCALFALLKELYPVKPIPENATDEERKALEKENEINKRKQTLSNMMELLRLARQEVDENQNTTSTLDEMFEKLRQVNRRSYAGKMWENFKSGGAKVCNEVIISAAAVFGRFFDTDDIAWLTMEDELHLEDLASEKKCALFLVIPQDTKTYNFMCSMIYSQLFSIATKAGKKWRDDHGLDNPALPRHLSFWLDEFANIGKIPSFMELLSVVRKYNISINIIIQGMAQLKALYPKDEWEIIFANLDTMIYLGGMEPSTVKWLSEKLGKETIRTLNSSYAKQGSMSSQSMAHSVLSPDQIEQMSRAWELVFISGCKPIQTRKFDLTKHPNYQYSGEAKSENNLNINEIFKDNKINYDLLDESTITVEDIKNYNFDNLWLREGHKRGSISPKEEPSAGASADSSSGRDVAYDTQQKINDVMNDETLSEEEKLRRIAEIKSAEKNQGLSASEMYSRFDFLNRHIVSGFEPNYEFRKEEFNYSDLNLDDFDDSDESVNANEEKLSIELIPSPLWGINLRKILTPKSWQILSGKVRQNNHFTCEVCKRTSSDLGGKDKLHAHEVWKYDDINHIQTLERVCCLCEDCHSVKHIGKANADGKFAQAREWYRRINNYTDNEADMRIKEAYSQFEERNKYSWDFRLNDKDIFSIYDGVSFSKWAKENLIELIEPDTVNISQAEDGRYYDTTTGEIIDKEPILSSLEENSTISSDDIPNISSDNILIDDIPDLNGIGFSEDEYPFDETLNDMEFTDADIMGNTPAYDTDALSESIEDGENIDNDADIDSGKTVDDNADIDTTTPETPEPEVNEENSDEEDSSVDDKVQPVASSSSDFDMFDFSMEDESYDEIVLNKDNKEDSDEENSDKPKGAGAGGGGLTHDMERNADRKNNKIYATINTDISR